MATSTLFLIPIVCGLVAVAATLLTVYMFFHSYETNSVGNKLVKSLTEKLKKIDLQTDLNDLLDKHLTEFIMTLKLQIPMAAMFLSGSLSDKLKLQAKEEFMKMLPELKDKIWDRFSHDLSFIEEMIKESVRKRLMRICLATSALGLGVGVAVMLIIGTFT